ncbi:uncharacterized protein LOC111322929 [Stylophora pistillata]|uniref:Uncharacterized protein n=1 Tax=Stylophora pistillata TaxID=50429 RepID=A0A2B4SR99_STYPI|nr:uncharacterized protein LOC111322929 [Stylophora pistillata]PFX30925.1 hypothetical protein AWC38_SpisGene4235 [Stylophora pistillata]
METLRGLKFFVLMSILLAQFSFYDANEKLQMTLSEPSSFKPPNAAICPMLRKLENLGYKKEERTSVKRLGKGGPDAEKEAYYYKLVNCSEKALLETGKELNSSIPGSFGKEMTREVVKEVSFRRLKDDNGMCKVGLVVNFRGGQDCDNTERKKTDRSHQSMKTKKSPIPREAELSKRRFRFRVRIRIRIKVKVAVTVKK